jgi:hypothetical protein
VITGAILSILFTVATAVAVLPAKSLNSKVNEPVLVNVYVNNQLLFVILPSSFKVIIATTF